MKRLSMVAASALVLSVLAGCGSDSDNDTKVGYKGKFVDSAVAGLSWSCGGVSGTTDADGVFGECPAGSSVTFAIGNVTLGTMSPTKDNIFTPQDLVGVPRATADSAKANKIASLLLSLDCDGNPDNGVSITPAIVTELNEAVGSSTNIANLSQEQVSGYAQQVIDAAPCINMQIVSPEAAASHLVETAADIEDGHIQPPAQPGDTTGATGAN
ncbi:MAG: hypothetical protein JXK05_12790 [Campylobacterales bacterium]|nr:hypothetical protein [Campylobacterales bacterium]